MATESFWLSSNTPPLFDGDQISSHTHTIKWQLEVIEEI
jgi:hypothetical protein